MAVAEPTLIVPLRAPPVLAATLYPTVPLPEPVAPDVIVIHDAPLIADQLQDEALETATEPVTPETAELRCSSMRYRFEEISLTRSSDFSNSAPVNSH